MHYAVYRIDEATQRRWLLVMIPHGHMQAQWFRQYRVVLASPKGSDQVCVFGSSLHTYNPSMNTYPEHSRLSLGGRALLYFRSMAKGKKGGARHVASFCFITCTEGTTHDPPLHARAQL